MECLICKISEKSHNEFMEFLNWLSEKEYYEQICCEFMEYKRELRGDEDGKKTTEEILKKYINENFIDSILPELENKQWVAVENLEELVQGMERVKRHINLFINDIKSLSVGKGGEE